MEAIWTVGAIPRDLVFADRMSLIWKRGRRALVPPFTHPLLLFAAPVPFCLRQNTQLQA
jgi:hypothetical protein